MFQMSFFGCSPSDGFARMKRGICKVQSEFCIVQAEFRKVQRELRRQHAELEKKLLGSQGGIDAEWQRLDDLEAQCAGEEQRLAKLCQAR